MSFAYHPSKSILFGERFRKISNNNFFQFSFNDIFVISQPNQISNSGTWSPLTLHCEMFAKFIQTCNIKLILQVKFYEIILEISQNKL